MTDDRAGLREAIEEFAVRLGEQGQSSDQIAAQVSELVMNSIDGVAPGLTAALVDGLSEMLRDRRTGRLLFERRLRYRWGSAFDLMFGLIEACGDSVTIFAERTKTPVSRQREALLSLHSRAWQAGLKVHTLLRHGYGAGARARARTMMELAAVCLVIAEHGQTPPHEQLAERFLRHAEVMAWKEAQSYQRAASDFGYQPYTEEELAELKSQFDRLVDRFGKDFATTYGWAAELTGNPNPKLADIQKLAALSNLAPFYSWASHSVHADSRGVAQARTERHGVLHLSPGPALSGLADAGQLAAIALYQCTAAVHSGCGDVEIEDLLGLGGIRGLLEMSTLAMVRAELKIRTESEPSSPTDGASNSKT